MDNAVKAQRDLVIATLLLNDCTGIGIQVFLIPSHSKMKARGEEGRAIKESLLFPVRGDWGLKQAMGINKI